MYSPSLLIFGVVILSISPVNCQGTASILNWCNFEVYVWSIANIPNNTINYLAPTTGDYSEIYRTNPNGGGISLKIATAPADSNITQFEYTYNTSNPYVYYDISNINGYPFEEWGLALSPSIPSTPPGPNCTSLSCDPGVALCADVYNVPDDDYAARECYVSTDLTLTLCPFQTTMATTTETANPSTMTTDSGDSTLLSTLTTMATTTDTANPSTMTTDSGGSTLLSTLTTMATTTDTANPSTMTTDSGGSTLLSTLTTMATTTDTANPSTMTTDSGGCTLLSTLTTMATTTDTANPSTNSGGSTLLSTLTTMATTTDTANPSTMTTDSGGSTRQQTRPTLP